MDAFDVLEQEFDGKIAALMREFNARIYAFCPTGEGGGIDNSCGGDGGEGGGGRQNKGETFIPRPGRNSGESYALDIRDLHALQSTNSALLMHSIPNYKKISQFYEYLKSRGWAEKLPATSNTTGVDVWRITAKGKNVIW